MPTLLLSKGCTTTVGGSGLRKLKGFCRNERVKFTIDRELYEVCELRKPRLVSRSLSISRRFFFDTAVSASLLVPTC